MTSSPKLKPRLDKLLEFEKGKRNSVLQSEWKKTELEDRSKLLEGKKAVLLKDEEIGFILQRSGLEKIEDFERSFISSPRQFFMKIDLGILPVQHKRFPWESIQSRRLRNRLREKAEELRNYLISSVNLSEDRICIEAKEVASMVLKHDEFHDRAMLVVKKPKKRNYEKAGVSIANIIYKVGNEHYSFKFVVKVVSESRRNEHLYSDMIRESVERAIRESVLEFNEQYLFKRVYEVLKEKICEIAMNEKISLTFALVSSSNEGNMLFYAGDVAIYELRGKALYAIPLEHFNPLGEGLQLVKVRRNKRILNMVFGDVGKMGIKALPDNVFIITSKEIAERIKDKLSLVRKHSSDNLKEIYNKARAAKRFSDDVFLFFA